MENEKVKEILNISKKIDKITFKNSYYFDIGKEKLLNYYDKQMLKFYQKILDLIVEITKEDRIKDVDMIDKKYFNKEENATMFLERYMALLQFYSRMDIRIFETEIKVILQMQENLKLDDSFEVENQIKLGNSYFHVGKEAMARKVMLEWIKEHPDDDDAYICMQNWYMLDEPNINKLAQVIDLAESNNHFLTNDLGYSKLVNFYSQIGDLKNKEKYQKIYEKWRAKRRM